jgi:hypothetical protein
MRPARRAAGGGEEGAMAWLRSRGVQVVGGLLVVAELVGLCAGWWFYRLIDRVVPQGSLSQANRLGALQLFLLRGALLGLVIFVCALLGILAWRLLRSRSDVATARP